MFIDNFKIEDDKLVAYSRENPELEKNWMSYGIKL